MEIVNRILEWPLIVQGALGSFLFWLLFTVGQKTFNFLNKKIKDEKKLGGYFGRTARDEFWLKNYNFSNYNFFVCIYASLHYFLKFALTVFVSLILADLIPAFAYVGYILAIYFIFRSLSYLTHFRAFEKEDEKKEKSKKSY